MLSAECRRELETFWLPNLTDGALDRIVELLDKQSPLLVHGVFTRSMALGCLATQAAWRHPRTAQRGDDAGLHWLVHVAGVNPATSHVIREWDSHGMHDWEMRSKLLAIFRAEKQKRTGQACPATPDLEFVSP
jgi:hypothetical protein